MIVFTLVKIAARATHGYWLYVKELNPELNTRDIITYDKYAGRTLRVDEIHPYSIETAGPAEHRVEEATHRIVCKEIGHKIDLENFGTFPAKKDWKFFVLEKKLQENLVE